MTHENSDGPVRDGDIRVIPDTTHSLSRRDRIRVVIAIIVVGLAAYGRVATFGFVLLDDKDLTAERANYLSHVATIPDAFQRNYWYGTSEAGGDGYYRPLVTVSFVLDALIAPASPYVAHITNILLHLAVALSLFTLLRRITVNENAAALLALLFAAHPLASNAVGWIVGRNDVLLALFVIWTVVFLIEYLRHGAVSALIGCACMYAAALLSKETAVVTPAVLVAWITVSGDGRRERRWIPVAIAVAGIMVLWWIVRSRIIAGSRADVLGALWDNLPLLLQTLGKAVLPVNLSTMATIADTSMIFGVVALACLAYFFWRTPSSARLRALFGIAWFLVFLAPALAWGRKDEMPVLECRAYLPLVGMLIAVALLEPVRSFKWSSTSGKVLAAACIIAFIVLSNYFADAYRDAHTFWTRTVQTSPSSSRAHMGYGFLLFADSLTYDAEREYREALRLDPTDPRAHMEIGKCLVSRGQLDSAEAEIRAQLATSDKNAMAWLGLAVVAQKRHDIAKMYAYLRQSVTVNPDFSAGWMELAYMQRKARDRRGFQECINRLLGLGIAIPSDLLEDSRN